MRCHRCGEEAIFEIRANGNHLCEKHFLSRVERRAKKTIRHNKLLASEDHVMVALSGGKDSSTCLSILSGIIGANPKTKLSAISIVEGIEGKDLGPAIKFCERLSIDHQIVSFKEHFGFSIDDAAPIAREDGVLACSICGVLKRRVINDKAKELGVSKVATGHNLDDELQAAFMNFVRGDLPRMARLSAEVGIAPHPGFVPRIKPLRDVPEAEVTLYARILDLPHIKSICPYSGTSYRTTAKKLLDELESRHPGSKEQMNSSVIALVEIMRERQKGEGPGECISCGEPTANELCKTCILLARLKDAGN